MLLSFPKEKRGVTLGTVAGSIGTAVLITILAVVTELHASSLGDTAAALSGINASGVGAASLSFIALLLSIIYVKVATENKDL